MRRKAQVYAAKLREAQASGAPNPALSVGFSHELCAGIIDKDKALEEIAHEEVGQQLMLRHCMCTSYLCTT